MISFDDLKAHLNHLEQIKDPLFKAYQIEAIAKEIDIPVDTLKQMLKDYQRQQKEIQVQCSKIKKLFWECELFLEGANQKLSEMDFFNILEYISRLSILFGIFLFFYEIPERQAARSDDDKQTVYRSWEIVNNSKNGNSNSGLILALEDLNEARESLKGIDLSNAQLSNFNNNLELKRAWLVKAKFDNASLLNVNFEEAELASASFIGADLIDANFRKAQLHNSHFQGASLRNTDFKSSRLNNANFQQADLTGAILEGADIAEANFTGVLGLTPEQIKSAKNWQAAIFDNNFLKQ